jgi:hypothetical protein
MKRRIGALPVPALRVACRESRLEARAWAEACGVARSADAGTHGDASRDAMATAMAAVRISAHLEGAGMSGLSRAIAGIGF